MKTHTAALVTRARTFRRLIVLPIMAVTMLSACAGSFEQGGINRADRSDVLSVGLGRLAELYVEPVDMQRLVVAGSSALTALDPAFTVTPTGSGLDIAFANRPLAQLQVPAAQDPRAWARLLDRIVAEGRTASITLAGLEEDALTTKVMGALTASLDAYSYYHDPATARADRATRDGYAGVGIILKRREAGDGVEIAEVMADGPAAEGGILAGDRILAVDGEAANGLDDVGIRDRVTGPPGTSVVLSVLRHDGSRHELRLTRRFLVPNMVRARLEDGVGIIRVARFNAFTARHISESIRALGDQGVEPPAGWVIDLRSNPGGLLDQAVEVADLFMRRGDILSTAGRHPDSRQYYAADHTDVVNDRPLVVLVDGNSASASEIVAAALKETGRAILIGTPSYGKGSVQTVTRLPNDGELFLTWSRMYGPSGQTFNEVGVMPTLCSATAATGLQPVTTAGECPRKPHQPVEGVPDADVELAKRLIADGRLYRQALAQERTLHAALPGEPAPGIGLRALTAQPASVN